MSESERQNRISSVKIKELKNAGFQCTGKWCNGTSGVSCKGSIPKKPGVYLFVVKQRIKYVGSARNLCERMKRYQGKQRQPTQGNERKTRPVHSRLSKLIRKSKIVKVYTLPIDNNEPYRWKDLLPVDLILGIEAALIAEINPRWNRRGRKPMLLVALQKPCNCSPCASRKLLGLDVARKIYPPSVVACIDANADAYCNRGLE
jgi:hypothetical protein